MFVKLLNALLGFFNFSIEKKDCNSTPEKMSSDALEGEVEEPLLLLKDVHENADGVRTDIEVRSDGIHLQEGDGEEQVFSLSADVFSLHDVDEDIRYQIARKISLLVPSLAKSKKEELLRYIFRVLLLLAEDQVTRVRRLIAEELRDSYDAPPELVRQLAWDDELEVSAPVLEFSPLLNEHDLKEIIGQCEIPGVLEAVSKRKDVSENVTEAIVKNVSRSRIDDADAQVINTLLSNQGAKFNEATMEFIVENAPEHEVWHSPLIDRPELTTRTVNKIAQFVSRAMIMELEERGMINEDQGRNLKLSIASRLQSPNVDREREADRMATEMFTQGTLTAEVIMESLNMGEREMVVSGISLLAETPKKITKKIMYGDDPKPVIALSWKAGLSMRDAIALQLKMAKINYTKVVYAKNGQDYPYSESEMRDMLQQKAA